MGIDNIARLYAAYFSSPWATRPFEHTTITRLAGENPTSDEVTVQQMEQKQQRAKLSQKRHKGKTFHVNKKKDVPAFLKQLAHKAL